MNTSTAILCPRRKNIASIAAFFDRAVYGYLIPLISDPAGSTAGEMRDERWHGVISEH